jgi:hypothetical protein
VRHCVLDNESLDPVRMGQGHAKTHRAAVILHVKGVAREPERFGEVIHDLGVVIERIREFFRVGPVAVSETRIIGRDKVVATGKPGEERREHPRGRRKSVQQEKRRRVFLTGLSVKDREPIDLYSAIEGGVLHGMFLSLILGGLGQQLRRCKHERKHQGDAQKLQASGPTGQAEKTHRSPSGSALLHFLEQPTVAIWIMEGRKRAIVTMPGAGPLARPSTPE